MSICFDDTICFNLSGKILVWSKYQFVHTGRKLREKIRACQAEIGVNQSYSTVPGSVLVVPRGGGYWYSTIPVLSTKILLQYDVLVA